MEPLQPGAPPANAFAGLSSLRDAGVPATEFLGGLIQADAQPEEGTRPNSLLAGESPELEIDLAEEDRNTLALQFCQMLDEYDVAHKGDWDTEDEIRDAYALKADTTMGGMFPGAAQMTSELILMMVDQADARVRSAVEQAKPLIRVDPIQGAYMGPESAADLAAKTQAFINPYTMEEMDFKHLLPAAILRLVKTGTAVFRVTFCEEEETVWEWPLTGGKAKKVTTSRGRVDAQLCDNRLVKVWPPYILNWQRATFVGYESVMAPSEWKATALKLKIPDEVVKRIEGDGSGARVAKVMADEGERHGIKSDQLNDEPLLKPQTLTELWCHMVLPGRTVAEKFQVILHRETRTICWIGYNAHHTGKHPFFPIRYKWNDSHAWGSGVGDEVLMMWAADTAMFNLMLDNLMAGCYFITLRKPGSVYSTQSDNPRPGMQIVTDDPEKDFRTLKLGGECPELGSARNDNTQRARMASGISSLAAGAADEVVKSGESSGGVQAKIDQSSIKLDMVDSNIRIDLTELYQHTLELIQQYAQEGLLTKYATTEEVGVLRELLYLPPRGQVSKLLRLRVEAPSANSTNDARQKTSMLIWNFAQQHVNTVNQIVMGLLQQQNPAAIPRWLEMCANYLTAIAQKVADTADLPGIAELVPQIPQALPPDQVINQQAQQLGSLQQQLAQAQQMLQTLAQQGADMCQFNDPAQQQASQDAGQAQDDGSGQMPPMDPSMMSGMQGDQGAPPS